MASLALINPDGTLHRKMGCHTQIPPHFTETYETEKGYMWSWEDMPSTNMMNSQKKFVTEIIRHGKATAYVEFKDTIVAVRIECPMTSKDPQAKDLFELRDIIVLYIGGAIFPARPPVEKTPSFIAGVRGDIQRLKNLVSTFFTSVRQRLGMKLASL